MTPGMIKAGATLLFLGILQKNHKQLSIYLTQILKRNNVFKSRECYPLNM